MPDTPETISDLRARCADFAARVGGDATVRAIISQDYIALMIAVSGSVTRVTGATIPDLFAKADAWLRERSAGPEMEWASWFEGVG